MKENSKGSPSKGSMPERLISAGTAFIMTEKTYDS